MFVAPSPKNATATRGSSRSLNARPAPVTAGRPPPIDGVRAEVAALDVVEVHRAAVAVRAALDLPVELGHERVRVRAARQRVPVGAVGRGEDVAVLHRLADADRDRLLADRDVQEARQLARAEPLLHLLLEAPDEEHLAQEVAQRLVVQGAFLLDLGQSSGSVRFDHERRAAVESHWIRVARDVGARLAPARAARSRGRRSGRCNAGADRPVPRLADDPAVFGRARRERSRTPRHHTTSRAHPGRHPVAVEFAGRGPAGRRARRPRSSRAGTRPSPVSRPTGATSTPRSSSPRATTSSPPRCSASR